MSQTVPSTRGYGITKADLDASRLFFVSLRDSVPKRHPTFLSSTPSESSPYRKVAVPVPDGYSWDQFLEQVKSKLRLEGIGSVYFASTGEKITSLDGLQDIDELCVDEGWLKPAVATMQEVAPPLEIPERVRVLLDDVPSSEIQIAASPSTRIYRQSSAVDGRMNHSLSVANGEVAEEEEEEKYAKRSTLLKRMAQRIFPDAFTPGLPLTLKSSSSEEKATKKRRRRRGGGGLSLLLVLAVVGSLITMLLIYYRSSTL